MRLKTLGSVGLTGKTILYRAPYDIELKDANGTLELEDDTRIKLTLPTLQHLLNQNCKIVVLTYVGRPDGKVVEELRTTVHAKALAKLLNHPVDKIDECIGEEVNTRIANMKSGEILMLENVRFHAEEMVDDDAFAEKLCEGKDYIVFDGFPQAHRIHASTTGILRHLPSVAGLYLEHEVVMLRTLLDNPQHPFTAIIGGAKISDKVDAINNLLNMADTVLVGGAVANVFLKALGHDIGGSYVEDVFVDKMKRDKKDWVEDAKGIIKNAESLGKKIIFPTDVVVFDGTQTKVLDITKEAIPEKSMALDIGPDTRKIFCDVIYGSKTIFMNGPMGKFEDEQFIFGTEAILHAMKNVGANSLGETIIAGGDTIDVVRKHGNLEDFSHVSLAGGATLEFLAGKELPALVPLME